MHADFSRFSAEPEEPWTRVLFQQGRVQLDQDLNAQVAIGLAVQRMMWRDLIGAHGAPRAGLGEEPPGFAVTGARDDPKAGAGRYWVDGWPVRSTAAVALRAQRPEIAEETEALDALRRGQPGIVWIEVWERVVTAAEQEALSRDTPWAPGFLEPALGGIEATLRARLAWRLRVAAGVADPKGFVPPRSTGRLAARAQEPPGAAETLCALDASARYRGPENQLYRVEIHAGGGADTARWKWSRENGSVALPVRSFGRDRAEIARGGRDARGGIPAGSWVEAMDAAAAEGIRPGAMARVEEVDAERGTMRLSGLDAPAGFDPAQVMFLRRWDHAGGATLPVAGKAEPWQALEEGVEVRFTADDAEGKPAVFRGGDHWLVPARVLIGNVIWPQETVGGGMEPALRPPHGPRRAAAPLAAYDAAGALTDARRLFKPLAG